MSNHIPDDDPGIRLLIKIEQELINAGNGVGEALENAEKQEPIKQILDDKNWLEEYHTDLENLRRDTEKCYYKVRNMRKYLVGTLGK